MKQYLLNVSNMVVLLRNWVRLGYEPVKSHLSKIRVRDLGNHGPPCPWFPTGQTTDHLVRGFPPNKPRTTLSVASHQTNHRLPQKKQSLLQPKIN